MKSVLSPEIESLSAGSSLIRKMFEAGIEMKKKFGAENVCDFSLGNPDVPPPPEVKDALESVAANAASPFAFGYMPNAGYPSTRAVMSAKISAEQGVEVPASNVIMTCGAAGGVNTLFRAILSPGDEVVCPAPYFAEYGFYAGNFGGKLVPVQSLRPSFAPDIPGIAAAINERTRAVIVNSPNNPAGVIYTRDELAALAAVLAEKSAVFGRPICLVSDEPYRFLNFDGVEIPSVFALYPASVVIGSFSKSLSLAGERIGYAAVAPDFPGGASLVSALTLTNRILGYVNAPAIAQKILDSCASVEASVATYRRRRDLMADVLRDAGIKFTLPAGAFYFFPESPVGDETVFVGALLKERVLAVPGRGFGAPGYFRLAFCVPGSTITNSAASFKAAVRAVR